MAASSSDPPPPPPPPTPLWSFGADDLVGPDKNGYIWRGQDKFGRITSFGNNGSIRCYEHPKCSLAIVVAKMPSIIDVKRWLLQGEPKNLGDCAEERQQKTAKHLALLRQLRDRPPAA